MLLFRSVLFTSILVSLVGCEGHHIRAEDGACLTCFNNPFTGQGINHAGNYEEQKAILDARKSNARVSAVGRSTQLDGDRQSSGTSYGDSGTPKFDVVTTNKYDFYGWKSDYDISGVRLGDDFSTAEQAFNDLKTTTSYLDFGIEMEGEKFKVVTLTKGSLNVNVRVMPDGRIYEMLYQQRIPEAQKAAVFDRFCKKYDLNCLGKGSERIIELSKQSEKDVLSVVIAPTGIDDGKLWVAVAYKLHNNLKFPTNWYFEERRVQKNLARIERQKKAAEKSRATTEEAVRF